MSDALKQVVEAWQAGGGFALVQACENAEKVIKESSRPNQTLDIALRLLKYARCSNCDGGGSIPVQVRARQLVTREMAMDAGDSSLEGSLYSDDEWEQEQCQWCAERAAVLKI